MVSAHVTPSTIVREAYAIYANLTKTSISHDAHLCIHTKKDFCTDTCHFDIEFAGKKLELEIPLMALQLSLEELGNAYLKPKIKQLESVRKALLRDNKILHMKRKLSCKAKIKIIH